MGGEGEGGRGESVGREGVAAMLRGGNGSWEKGEKDN